MKCTTCNNEFEVKLGSKIISKGCRILTAMTTVITVECEKCQTIFQVPVTSKSFMMIKKDSEE